ncbi:hypothetical protein [Pannonibacter phragmitetus]|uniref:hypothetical protein n=1 Tax=Pannonibacter phragmitetus TaxID=121719 RepID=UPI003D2F4B71
MTSIYANGGFTQESWERLDKDAELPAHPFADGLKLLVPQARFWRMPAHSLRWPLISPFW